MNDLDTTIKDLINSAVDHELGGRRSAPPLDRSALLERPGAAPSRPAHPVAAWGVPVLAASVAALLAAGTVIGIGHGRNGHPAPAANSAHPTPSASASPSQSTNPDQEAAASAYIEAVVRALEATDAPGVSVGPVSAKDAAQYEDSRLWTVPDPGPKTPEPGRSYPITIRYVVGSRTQPKGSAAGDVVTVLSGELRDVAAGNCPPPFLVRPGHTYLITCQVTFLPGTTGEAAFTDRNRTGTWGYGFNLGDSASAATTTLSPEQQQAARDYAEAVASAPEASKVAGVSDRPASAQEIHAGETVGLVDGPAVAPDRGRSYPLTLLYIPSSDGPAISVLAVRLEGVAASRCPRAFRIRPDHYYLVSCQVTFRPGVTGTAYYKATGPQGVSTAGFDIHSP